MQPSRVKGLKGFGFRVSGLGTTGIPQNLNANATQVRAASSGCSVGGLVGGRGQRVTTPKGHGGGGGGGGVDG